MNIDLSSVVDALSGSTVTRRRWAAGTVAHGVYTQGASSDTTISCSLTAPTSRAMQLLPEGLRSRARWLMHTTADVRTADETNRLMADQILVDGRTFVVFNTGDWTQQGGFREIVLLEEPGS